jgi:ribulose-5-phosphate 4-epimerase/fuculose-1-phosphate aldolase
MFEKEKLEIIKAGMNLDRYGLIALSGGNLSSRMPSGEILVTPSGMIYEDMVPEDVLVMDLDENIIEGTRKPSSDTEAILYIFKKRPDINAVIHTHQPYATAVGLICDEFKVNLTTLANAAGGSVKVSPYSSPGSIDMGIDTINYLGDSLAVILAHHGVMTVGTSLKQALYAAVYMEESAKGYLAAAAVGNMKEMSDAQIKQAVEVFKYYGQGNTSIPKELLKRV